MTKLKMFTFFADWCGGALTISSRPDVPPAQALAAECSDGVGDGKGNCGCDGEEFCLEGSPSSAGGAADISWLFKASLTCLTPRGQSIETTSVSDSCCQHASHSTSSWGPCSMSDEHLQLPYVGVADADSDVDSDVEFGSHS
jgi:hypothetical protein